MSQFSSIAFTGRTSSSALRSRAAVFAPVISAVLSLSSFAYAEPPAENATPVAAAPTAPAAVAQSAGAPAPTAAPAPVAASAAAPAPAAVAAPAPVAPSAAATAPVSVEHEVSRPGRVHEGFYLRLASGPSVMSLRGHGPSGSASITGGGGTGSIVIGGALVPGLVLAGTAQGASTDAEFKGGPFRDATLTVNGETRSASHHAQASFGMVGVLLDWYPQPRAGWHAGVATGIGAVSLKNSADNSTFAGVNLNGSLFGGYDWTLGRDWALGLQLTVSGGTRTKMLEDSGDHDTG